MIKKINDLLNTLPFIIIAGASCAVSFFMIPEFFGFLPYPVLFGAMFDPAWIAVIICGTPLVYLAISRVIKQRFISSALLISMAMVAAIAINELFAAGEVAFIMALGGFLEDKTLNKARKGINKLLSLKPLQGRKLTQNADGSFMEEMVEADGLKIGETVRVLPGEAIPADGIIIKGNTSVDQSFLTGESLPAEKGGGDEVFAGTINCFGTADIKITKSPENSTLQKMVRLVKEAENNKAPTQKIVDKFAQWLVPLVLLMAIATYVITGEIVRAVVLLIVFCPCALALATPTSIIAAIGQAAKHGVLIKSGEALENMGKIGAVTFDKTGTLTYGKLIVSDIVPAQNSKLSPDEILALAASAESGSEHPLGKAIVKFAEERGVAVQGSEDFVMTVGKGIKARVNNEIILCGNTSFLNENSVAKPDKRDIGKMAELQSRGKAVTAIAKGSTYLGFAALSDAYRQDAGLMIKKLADTGVRKIALLTGDHKKTAEYIASQIGLEDVRAELLPADKVRHIKEIQAEDIKVCMVGDGVNDAPALKTADVGIAMACMGSDIAIEAADIALMSDDVLKIPYVKALSNATVFSIKINIFLSMFINAVAIYLSIMGMIGPVAGALFHNIGSVLIVLNASRLYDKKVYKKLYREKSL
ncbi:MAG: cation-translocating P-type ATPase [Oscillospiraceae bacterium]|jgi:heavy metal translocating P-type ATPase|nr:cation-translocating P-type ATPase [Oscillospiraceae bacterium]